MSSIAVANRSTLLKHKLSHEYAQLESVKEQKLAHANKVFPSEFASWTKKATLLQLEQVIRMFLNFYLIQYGTENGIPSIPLDLNFQTQVQQVQSEVLDGPNPVQSNDSLITAWLRKNRAHKPEIFTDPTKTKYKEYIEVVIGKDVAYKIYFSLYGFRIFQEISSSSFQSAQMHMLKWVTEHYLRNINQDMSVICYSGRRPGLLGLHCKMRYLGTRLSSLESINCSPRLVGDAVLSDVAWILSYANEDQEIREKHSLATMSSCEFTTRVIERFEMDSNLEWLKTILPKFEIGQVYPVYIGGHDDCRVHIDFGLQVCTTNTSIFSDNTYESLANHADADLRCGDSIGRYGFSDCFRDLLFYRKNIKLNVQSIKWDWMTADRSQQAGKSDYIKLFMEESRDMLGSVAPFYDDFLEQLYEFYIVNRPNILNCLSVFITVDCIAEMLIDYL